MTIHIRVTPEGLDPFVLLLFWSGIGSVYTAYDRHCLHLLRLVNGASGDIWIAVIHRLTLHPESRSWLWFVYWITHVSPRAAVASFKASFTPPNYHRGHLCGRHLLGMPHVNGARLFSHVNALRPSPPSPPSPLQRGFRPVRYSRWALPYSLQQWPVPLCTQPR